MAFQCENCSFASIATKELDKEQLDLLGTSCTEVEFKKGDNIFVQNAFSFNVVFMKKGLVKLHMKGLNGMEQIIKIVKAPKYMGISTALGNKINNYSATALEDSQVCFIDRDRDTFKKIVEHKCSIFLPDHSGYVE